MNYIQYERQIVEKLGVVLVGWPLGGRICNPGALASGDALVLKEALTNKTCKWVKLTAQQLNERKASNKQRADAGEDVYGPLWKKRASKTGPSDCQRDEDEDIGEMEVDGESLERAGTSV
jgi:hypothetical protein